MKSIKVQHFLLSGSSNHRTFLIWIHIKNHLRLKKMIGAAVLFVLFMAVSASEADWNSFVKEQIRDKGKASEENSCCCPSCPFGWVKFDGRCFSYFGKELDWTTAEAYCLNLGANLVSVHNENEYQMVKALVRGYDPKENPTWLGLSNCQKRDNWIWSDGTKFDYSRWNSNEPNHNAGECCVHMNWATQKNWNDIPCGGKYPFVCVKSLQP